jgi:hypothetical protein
MNLELTDAQTAALLSELDRIIDADRYPLSPRIRTLKEIRAIIATSSRRFFGKAAALVCLASSSAIFPPPGDAVGLEAETFKYHKAAGVSEELPWVIETAFGWCPRQLADDWC